MLQAKAVRKILLLNMSSVELRASKEKAMAPHSSTLAWKIPWTEEPGRLQARASLRVRCDWAASLSLFAFMLWRRTKQPTPMFLPGESHGRGNLVGCHLWDVTQSRTRLKRLSSSSSSSKEALHLVGVRLPGILIPTFQFNSCVTLRKLFNPFFTSIFSYMKWS